MQNNGHCSITHAQIANGDCPQCGLPIHNGSVARTRSIGRDAFQWNIPRMLEDLDSTDATKRLVTVTNLVERLGTLEESLMVLHRGLADSDQSVRGKAYQGTARLAQDGTTVWDGGSVRGRTCRANERPCEHGGPPLHLPNGTI